MPASTPGFLRKLPISCAHHADRRDAGARRRVGHGVGDRIAQDGDDRRQQGHEDGAEHRAVQRAQPAHDHQQQELDRQQDGEDVGRQVGDLVGEQRARQPHQRGRVGESHRLVDREVDAHRLGGDLAVADGDPGAAGGRAQQVARQPQRQHQEEQAEIVERPVVLEGHAEDDRLGHRHAGKAVRHRLPAAEHFLDDHREGERGDGEVDAGHAQRRQADDEAARRGDQHGQDHGDDPGHAVLQEEGVGVGADAEERGMAQRDQAGVAHQHHQ